MNKKESKRQRISRKLLHKYRLVVLNDDTFEERFSFKLNRLNVFVFSAFFALFLIGITTLIIAFTPLREYIPGYSSTALKNKATDLAYTTDSLQQVVAMNEQYIASIRRVLSGDVTTVNFNRDSILEAAKVDISEVDLNPSKADSLLRDQVEQEDKYNIFESDNQKNFVLFPPVNGTLTDAYDPNNKHFAVDIVAAKDAPVKAVADGTVIFASWTTDTGYVMIIDHGNNLISAYKHNSSLSKEQGDLVSSGEVIAIVGNTGELTTGPHLHFELWSDGYPIDPSQFIDFD
ncbi:M23 family metallopeptidase [Gilvibacter sediminis]|uniref:M23 family metallopeptidase n=1 Tax=Gilvibacter sediminis TaxID=379071 RepID=UPI00234FD907|nr:M23 family metallopeptidase [Gilvibacter sediminis]MDC7996805.1 M23 family metallopeptidase [Gilvibacter sediminis]